MLRRRLLIVVSLLAVACCTRTAAQVSPRTPDLGMPDTVEAVSHNVGAILFDRNLDTYNWVGRLFLDTTVLGTSVRWRQQYLTNIVRLVPGSSAPLTTLESTQHMLGVGLGRRLSELVGIRAEWASLAFNDTRGIGLSEAEYRSVLAGLDLFPHRLVTITPEAGYSWDMQGSIRDEGPSAQLLLRTGMLNLDGYRILGLGQYRTDWLDPRRLERHFLRVKVARIFSGGTIDSLEAGFARNRREFYVSGDSVIESRLEDMITLGNLLTYQISRTLSSSLYFTLNSRALDKDVRTSSTFGFATPQFPTQIEELVLEGHLQTAYLSDDGRTNAFLRLSLGQRDESHGAVLPAGAPPNVVVLWNERNKQEQTKDNLSRRTLLTGTVGFPLSLSDRMAITGSASILRYDTPSALNVEDRDELLVAGSIVTDHRLSRFLDLRVELDATMSHLVYLLEERSANNAINRVLRLAPRVTYRPSPAITSANVFEVLANYTVYDFEKDVAVAKSFSYRQFAWLDSTSVNLTERIGLDFFAYFKLYERGLLRWDEFTEQRENSFFDRTIDILARYSPAPGTILAAGFRSFSQSRYGYDNGARKLQSFLSSAGPTCLIQWEIGAHSRLGLRGWYERRRQPDGSIRKLPTLAMNVFVNL